MSTSNTNIKLNDLCDDLEGCKLGKISDEDLFKQPPPLEDCPICFQRMPSLSSTGSKYKACCGKVICSGCIYAPVYDNQGNIIAEKKCPFCRTPSPTSDEESLERERKRVEAGDAYAIGKLGSYYADGLYGYPQDYKKALELYHRVVELGSAKAYNDIGVAYMYGEGVDVDKRKAGHYYQLAAIGGSVVARHNLGNDEVLSCNYERALKHFIIAVRGGSNSSLEMIKQMYSNGDATKEDYTIALQSYQAYLGEIKSTQRDKAAAASERYRYC